jgi:hypothetical protein
MIIPLEHGGKLAWVWISLRRRRQLRRLIELPGTTGRATLDLSPRSPAIHSSLEQAVRRIAGVEFGIGKCSKIPVRKPTIIHHARPNSRSSSEKRSYVSSW